MFVILKVYNALPDEEVSLKRAFEREFGDLLIGLSFPELSDDDIRKRTGLSAGVQCSRTKYQIDGESVTDEEISREMEVVAFILGQHIKDRLASQQMPNRES